MTKELLLIASGEHTASCFARKLLGQHPQISAEDVVHKFYMQQDASSRYLYGAGDRISCHGDEFRDALLALGQERETYIQWNQYVHDPHFLPLLLHKPFAFKLVITLRHPERVLKTLYRRGEGMRNALSFYLTLLYVIKMNRSNAFVFQADGLASRTAEERTQFLSGLFVDYLGLDISEGVQKSINLWCPENPTASSDPRHRALADNEADEIVKQIESSRVFDILDQLALPFAYKQGEVALV